MSSFKEQALQNFSQDELLDLGLSVLFTPRSQQDTGALVADFMGLVSFERPDDLDVLYQRLCHAVGW